MFGTWFQVVVLIGAIGGIFILCGKLRKKTIIDAIIAKKK